MFWLLCSVHQRRNQFFFFSFFTYCAYLTFCTNTEKYTEDRWVSVLLKWFDQLSIWKKKKKYKAATCTDFTIKFFLWVRFIEFYFVAMCLLCYPVRDRAEKQYSVTLTTCMQNTLAGNNAFYWACEQHFQVSVSKSGLGKSRLYISYTSVGTLSRLLTSMYICIVPVGACFSMLFLPLPRTSEFQDSWLTVHSLLWGWRQIGKKIKKKKMQLTQRQPSWDWTCCQLRNW